jgi:hypothetical protein
MGRPRDTFMGAPTLDYDQLHLIPRYPLAYITMYQGMYMNLPWRFAVQTKKQEKYRRGIGVYPLFRSRCKKCGTKFDKMSPKQKCTRLGCNGELEGPNEDEKVKAENWVKNINLNHETLQMMMEMTAEDIAVTDEGYIIFRKEYILDKEGEIAYFKVKETVWGSPIMVRPVQNAHTGTPGGVMYVCPGEHRNDLSCRVMREKMSQEQGANVQVAIGERPEVPFDAGKCKRCRARLQDVKYVALYHERGHIEQFYLEGEVEHWHEYKQAHGLSVPPGLTLWISSSIITYKDAYVRDSYMKQRKPRGAVVVATSNPDDFINRWDNIMEKTKNDWHYMPVIPFEPEPGQGQSGTNRIAWVDFMGTMMDLDYKEIREVYERQIYEFYGIGNIFANIETGHAGKGGTEAKLIVSNRHVEFSNNTDNNGPLLRISAEIGLKDWVFRVNPPEDRDVMKEFQLETHQLNNAQMRMYLGYECEMDETGKELSYRKDRQKELQKAITVVQSLVNLKTGGMGAMGGGAGGMPPPGGAGGSPQGPPKNIPTAKPKVDSAEFSGTATDFDKAGYATDQDIQDFVDKKVGEGIAVKDARQFVMGVRVELEHTDNLEVAFKIAHDHLMEIPDYYTRLLRMEATALKKALADERMHEGNSNPTAPSVNVPNAPGANPQGGYYAPDGKGPFASKQSLGGYMRTRDQGQGEKGAVGDQGAMMGMMASKDDYLKAIKETKKLNVVSDEILNAVKAMVEGMEDGIEASPPGVQAGSQVKTKEGQANSKANPSNPTPGKDN